MAPAHLQRLPLPDQIADGDAWIGALRLAPTPGLVPILLQLHQLGKSARSARDPPRLGIGQTGFGDCDRSIRLAVDMHQDNAIGIDDPVSTGYRFDRPGLGRAA